MEVKLKSCPVYDVSQVHTLPAAFFVSFLFICDLYLVSERKLSFSPISASDKNINPQNTQCILAVKILIFLDLDEKS